VIRIGVDAGGTFTDCLAVGEGEHAGWRCERKLPSRADDPAAVVMAALDALVPAEYAGPVELVYSTTAATNALLTRRGGPVLLFTTAGFEDVLEIARQTRPELYALEPHKAPPLVAAEDRVGVEERVDVHGATLQPLGKAAFASALAAAQARPDARIAICFLHAYVEPAHEARLADALRAAGRHVSVSSEVCPLPREYERSSTTVIDAYVAPALGATLTRIERPGLSLRVMESTGGARQRGLVRPVRTVLSGPAAGVIAVEALARARGIEHAFAIDIGGTSTDVALIVDGHVARVDEIAVDGLPIALPSLDVHTVGAGGGSIAWIDDGGALRVGPRSAGARPGPAAYDLGGEEPTLTDAHVVLGRLGATLCGGAVALNAARARTAVERIAVPLALSTEAAAAAIVAVAEAKMARALRGVGEPIAAAKLIAYGGAGPLHAVALARELGVTQAVVPPTPGLLCARGALAANVVVDALTGWQETLVECPSNAARAKLGSLRDEVVRGLEREAPGRRHEVEVLVRARYQGQGVDAELELVADEASAEIFAVTHERAFGYRLDDRTVELTRLYVRGLGEIGTQAPPPPISRGDTERETCRVFYADAWLQATRYQRAQLQPEQSITGPALVDEDTATSWLPPGSSAVVESDGSLRISCSA
jgi:N-methylhydantoinase A